MDVLTAGWDVYEDAGTKGQEQSMAGESSMHLGVDSDGGPDGTQPMELDSDPRQEPSVSASRPVASSALECGFNATSLQIISRTTLLLHTLITDPRTGNTADIGTKLASSHGGPQRYQLTLARLNFADEDLRARGWHRHGDDRAGSRAA